MIGFQEIASKKHIQNYNSQRANKECEKSRQEMLSNDIGLATLRAAIDKDCFQTFAQFEYALFRVVEQAN